MSSPRTSAAEPLPSSALVVVTGASGFLGGWVIVEMLQRGYEVRATVRDLARSESVRKSVATRADVGLLSFAQADLNEDGGWAEAMDGAGGVLHVASPLPIGEYAGAGLVEPARSGTERVMKAADAAGVGRIVVTSSVNAAQPADGVGTIREDVWADWPERPSLEYARSKVFAERAAWDLAGREGFGPQLATILPTAILGPQLEGAPIRSSGQVVGAMLSGQMKAIPNFGWTVVDVRDLAELHARALIEPAAAGERFVAGGEFLWFADIARLLRDELGDAAAKVPKRGLPDFVVRLAARFKPELQMIADGLGRQQPVDGSKVERILGWHSRPARESILDAARSLAA